MLLYVRLNVSKNKGEKLLLAPPFSHNGTLFLICHKVQDTQRFITLTQTLDTEKYDWDSIFRRSGSPLDSIF